MPTTRSATAAATLPASSAAGHWLPPALAGLMATLLGLGLARFAYTPLLPALVQQGWLRADAAAYLGAAALLGYLIGALLAARAAARWGNVPVLKAMMLLTALALAACAWNGGVLWLSVWRVVAGITGAVLVVLAAPTVVAGLPLARKARAVAVVFSGIGLGVILAGFGMPVLAGQGLSTAWLVLGAAALLLTALAWRLWPAGGPAWPAAAMAAPVPSHAKALALFTLAYAGDGFGYVPHTLYLSDFVARGLGQGVTAGGFYWALFGAGAAAGAAVAGLLAARLGFGRAFVLVLALKAGAVALPLLSTAGPVLALSAILVGLLTPGSVALASGVSAQLAGPAGHVRAWGRMTAVFAATQVVGGYGLSALFAAVGSHRPLFALGALALAAGAAVGLLALRIDHEEPRAS